MKAPPSTPVAQIARDARLLARAANSGALATHRRGPRGGDHPYVSKVGVALDGDGHAIFLFSTLAAHTQDLLADSRCSLLLEAPSASANPLEAPRVTLVGTARRLSGAAALAVRAIYLARHPAAAHYVDFGDFAFWRLAVDKFHFVGGFGIAKWAKSADYVTLAKNLSVAREKLLKDLNGAKKSSLAKAMGQNRVLGKAWQAVDVDPDGVSLLGPKGARLRLNFLSPAKDLDAWRRRFAACIKRAAAKS